MVEKIDVHCHTTNRLLHGLQSYSATLETISDLMREHEIKRTVVLATYFPHKGSGISNFRLWDWIRYQGQFLMFGSLDFEHYFNQGYNELEELAERGLIKGIKIYTCYQQINPRDLKLRRVGELAQRFNLVMMFHSGYSHGHEDGQIAIANAVKPSDIEWLAQELGVTVIVSHMAKPFFDDLIEVVGRTQNIYTDMGGLIDSAKPKDRLDIPSDIEQIKRFLGECGPRKLMFATDFPIQSHTDSVNYIEKAMEDFSEAEKRLVYFGNAHRVVILRKIKKGDESVG